MSSTKQTNNNHTAHSNELLRVIADATLSASGHAFLSPAEVKMILAHGEGLVQLDMNVRDKRGYVAARTTQAGLDRVFGAGLPIAESAPESNLGFKIDSAVPIPAPQRGILGEPRYPFGILEVGQSFMVPISKEKPNPAKTLASTVSSANKRYRKSGKRFIIRPVEGGARIWRLE
jgi:hypothetical protein